MLGLAKKLFGSSNERKVKTFQARVAKINAYEAEYAALSDEALKRQDRRVQGLAWKRAKRSTTS
jgi:preprotein translocase subunit SecA